MSSGEAVPSGRASEPEAIILDVGHGNAAVFLDRDTAVVVDAGPGNLVGETLVDHGVSDVVSLVISHRHRDHTSEIASLLSSGAFRVGRLWVNADPTRDPEGDFEKQLCAAANDAFERSGTVTMSVNHTCGREMGTDRLEVDVLAPRVEDWAGGIGSVSAGGEITTHALSVVLRVGVEGGRSVLLCADQDHSGFRRLIDSQNAAFSADAMVYPHHGGLTGAPDEGVFARELTVAVEPDVVIFSNGRGKHDNPRPAVVRGVRSARASPPVRVLCTQLSPICSAVTHESVGRLDASLLSRGSATGESCSGSLRLALTGDGPLVPSGAAHLRFVLDVVGDGLCTIAHPGRAGAGHPRASA